MSTNVHSASTHVMLMRNAVILKVHITASVSLDIPEMGRFAQVLTDR
jgi:hypothetical protein